MARLFSEILGREVEVPDSPSRIVSFSPAATETLFEIGLGDRVAGVSAFCARPPEARKKRRVGSYNTVSEDLLKELRPDLILTVTGYQRDFAVSLSRKYPVYPLELPLTVAGIADFVAKVGLVTGAREGARTLASALLRKMGSIAKGPRLLAYVEIDLGGPVSFGAHSYITDALNFLGARSVFEDRRCEWLAPAFSDVSREDPDLLVFEPKMVADRDRGAPGKLLEERGWTGLRAVKSGNCFVTPGSLDFLAHHGPSFIREALPWLRKTMDEASARLQDS